MSLAMFETETKVFEDHREEWAVAGQVDRWVVIHGEDVIGFSDTLEEAVAVAEEKFGKDSVFIRRVTVEDTTEAIQRLGW